MWASLQILNFTPVYIFCHDFNMLWVWHRYQKMRVPLHIMYNKSVITCTVLRDIKLSLNFSAHWRSELHAHLCRSHLWHTAEHPIKPYHVWTIVHNFYNPVILLSLGPLLSILLSKVLFILVFPSVSAKCPPIWLYAIWSS